MDMPRRLLGSKETRASKEITVTHNSVFAAHRLQCRMTNRKNRHPAFCLYRKIESGKQELRNREAPTPVALTRYFSIRETCPAASCQRPSRLISVSVNCTTRSKDLPSDVPFTRVFREQLPCHRKAALTCRSFQIRCNGLSRCVAR